MSGAPSKDIQFTSFCQAMVDLTYPFTFPELETWNLQRGSWQILSVEERHRMLRDLGGRNPIMAPGGALANTTLCLAKLGAKTAFLSAVGTDSFGRHFTDEFRQSGVVVPLDCTQHGTTGVCICLVTPDGERTMRTELGRSSKLLPEYLDPEIIGRSEWLSLSSYLYCQEDGAELVEAAFDMARELKTKIAFTLGDRAVVEANRWALLKLVPRASLVIGNFQEVAALLGTQDRATMLRNFFDLVAIPAVTSGADGCWIKEGGAPLCVPAEPCRPVNLTGAGDTFMGGFVYGVIQGLSNREAAARAARLSRCAITHPFGRWGIDYRLVWNSYEQSSDSSSTDSCTNAYRSSEISAAP